MFWWDNWCDHTNLVELFGLDPTSIQNPELRVCDFITNDKCWDSAKIQSLVSREDIVQKMIGIPLLHMESEDSFC